LCAAGTRRSPPLTADELVRLRDLWVDGVPVNDIIREFRVSFSRLHALVKLCGLPARRDHALFVPSPAEIQRECRRFRESWSDEERHRRATRIIDPLPASFYRQDPAPVDMLGGEVDL
jgi:hypothetical protein